MTNAGKCDKCKEPYRSFSEKYSHQCKIELDLKVVFKGEVLCPSYEWKTKLEPRQFRGEFKARFQMSSEGFDCYFGREEASAYLKSCNLLSLPPQELSVTYFPINCVSRVVRKEIGEKINDFKEEKDFQNHVREGLPRGTGEEEVRKKAALFLNKFLKSCFDCSCEELTEFSGGKKDALSVRKSLVPFLELSWGMSEDFDEEETQISETVTLFMNHLPFIPQVQCTWARCAIKRGLLNSAIWSLRSALTLSSTKEEKKHCLQLYHKIVDEIPQPNNPSLPKFVILKILEHTDSQTVLSFSCTNKKWNNILNSNEHIWKRMVEKKEEESDCREFVGDWKEYAKYSAASKVYEKMFLEDYLEFLFSCFVNQSSTKEELSTLYSFVKKFPQMRFQCGKTWCSLSLQLSDLEKRLQFVKFVAETIGAHTFFHQITVVRGSAVSSFMQQLTSWLKRGEWEEFLLPLFQLVPPRKMTLFIVVHLYSAFQLLHNQAAKQFYSFLMRYCDKEESNLLFCKAHIYHNFPEPFQLFFFEILESNQVDLSQHFNSRGESPITCFFTRGSDNQWRSCFNEEHVRLVSLLHKKANVSFLSKRGNAYSGLEVLCFQVFDKASTMFQKILVNHCQELKKIAEELKRHFCDKCKTYWSEDDERLECNYHAKEPIFSKSGNMFPCCDNPKPCFTESSHKLNQYKW